MNDRKTLTIYRSVQLDQNTNIDKRELAITIKIRGTISDKIIHAFIIIKNQIYKIEKPSSTIDSIHTTK